jgi:bifunctional DNA-binding transcriptional regulator/antitoxin component of YhaV-PrlF toxin-antitoxin module
MEAIIEMTKMSTKGQVQVPKDVRDFTNSKTNTQFTIMPLDKETIVLKKLNKEEAIKEIDRIRARVKDKLTEDEINEIIKKVR